jgi:hypothetical protein
MFANPVKLYKGISSVMSPPKSFVNTHFLSRLDAHTFDIRNAVASGFVETLQAGAGAVDTVHIATGHCTFVGMITQLANSYNTRLLPFIFRQSSGITDNSRFTPGLLF